MTTHRTLVSPVAILAVASTQLAGCEAIQGIFKVGVWAGVAIAAVCVALVLGVTRMMRR